MNDERANKQNIESPENELYVSKDERAIIMDYIQGNITESELRYHLQDRTSFERFMDHFTTS